jgi:hypothetical protein
MKLVILKNKILNINNFLKKLIPSKSWSNHSKYVTTLLNFIYGFFIYKNIVGCCIIVTKFNYKIITIWLEV